MLWINNALLVKTSASTGRKLQTYVIQKIRVNIYISHQTHVLRHSTFCFSSLLSVISVDLPRSCLVKNWDNLSRETLYMWSSNNFIFKVTCARTSYRVFRKSAKMISLCKFNELKDLFCYIIIYKKVAHLFLCNISTNEKLQKLPEWDTKTNTYQMFSKGIHCMSFIEIKSTLKLDWNGLSILRVMTHNLFWGSEESTKFHERSTHFCTLRENAIIKINQTSLVLLSIDRLYCCYNFFYWLKPNPEGFHRLHFCLHFHPLESIERG